MRDEPWGLGRQSSKRALRSCVKEFGSSPAEGSSTALEDVNPGSERSALPAARWVGSGRWREVSVKGRGAREPMRTAVQLPGVLRSVSLRLILVTTCRRVRLFSLSR